MDENRIRQIIQEEINGYMDRQQYNFSRIPSHEHNGIDSPVLIAPTISYIGFVPYMADPLLEYILPANWSVRYDSTGFYTIIHNLGKISENNFYTVTTNATQSTGVIVVPVISMFENEVTIAWFDSTLGTLGLKPVDTSFNFILTTGNNKSPLKVGYITRNVI